MDTTELKSALVVFQEACNQKGRPLTDLCIEEAFPGDESTSFIVQVKAPWVDDMDCSEALDFLFDTLWETTDENIRQKVFSILVLDSEEKIHCWQEN